MRPILVLSLALGLWLPAQAPFSRALGLLRRCPPGAAGQWERMALDPETRRLYVPEPSGVRVLDQDGRQVGTVSGSRGVHSVALAPELGIGIFSNGRSSTLSVFNLTSLVVEKELRTTGGNPEAVLFDPAFRRIFSFNQRGRNATAFDGFGGAVAGSIALGGQPGTAVADGQGRLFVSLKDTREVLVLDAGKLVVLRRWSLPDLEEPSGLALDPVRKRLFVVGASQAMAILDSETGRLLVTLPIGAGAGAPLCDPETGEAYVSHPDGSITVVDPDAAGSYRVGLRLPADHGC
jgi:DNA-binding beta-propeller fold protein YncE